MPDVEVPNSPGRPLSWQSCPHRGLALARTGSFWVTDPFEQLQLGGVCLSQHLHGNVLHTISHCLEHLQRCGPVEAVKALLWARTWRPVSHHGLSQAQRKRKGPSNATRMLCSQ